MYVNGTAGTQDNSAPPIATAPGMGGMAAPSGFTPARIEEIRTQLLDPFDPAENQVAGDGNLDPAKQKRPGETWPVGGVRGPARLHGPAE